MRRRYGFLASSIGVTSAAALALTPSLPAAAATTTVSGASAAPVAAPPVPAVQRAGTEAADVPGSTQSLPLVPLTEGRAHGRSLTVPRGHAPRGHAARGLASARGPAVTPTDGAVPEQGLRRADVRHFSLLGVVWDNPDTELHGSVQVRTRSVATGTWSGWQAVETHNADHGADPGTAERALRHVRGATAPLWVGDCDGVDVRVRADTGDRDQGADTDPPLPLPLPSGLRLELVDPGGDPGGDPGDGLGDESPVPSPEPDQPRTGELSEAATAASAANAGLAPIGATEIPALGREDTERELFALRGGELTERQRAQPHIGPRPKIITRRGWGADESLRARGFVYTKKDKVAFVHHTATGNNYTCSEAPSVIRSIYRYHVLSMGWRDIGYNFLVDKCGTIYEGRAGGVAKPVLGAHTMGFNSNSVGIAVIGTYSRSKPSSAAVKAVARLAAWKLGLYGMNPRGKTYLKSAGGNLYQKGKNVRLNVISGHRDGFATDCPGAKLYGKLGTARKTAARYQGR
ncbi:peptidoglycan recognition protein [Streptomyces sp. NPDC006393]|uniref:peptidoglycan recognition protein family protein n=1 Tax=Streptomyces sp. NPDC006393 TaxID=3156763 RepID=UPI0033EFFED2